MSSKQNTSASQKLLNRTWKEYRLYDALNRYSEASTPAAISLSNEIYREAAMQKVSKQSALFIRAFGRDDLTDDDISTIGVIIDAFVTQSDPDTFRDTCDILLSNAAYCNARELSEQAGVNESTLETFGVNTV